jgi:type I restriction enzyme S subunit
MNVDSKKVPKLRFPEFADEWQLNKLGDLVDISSSKRVLQKDWVSSGVPFYRTREIVSLAKHNPFSTPIFINESMYNDISKKYGVPKKGDLLATGVGSIGEIYLVNNDDKFYFKDGNVLWFKQSSKLDSSYLYQAFRTRFIQKQIEDNASVTTVATFTIDGAKKTEIYRPGKPEQQKIADFLTAVDDKIATIEKRVELLQKYKKGVMQQIFSQKIRFKDENGNNFSDWQKKRLGSIGKFTSGQGFSEKEQGGKTGVPFFKVSDMNLVGNEKIMNSANNYVSTAQIKDLKYKPITQKSIIFAKVGAAIFLERKRLAENFLIDNNMMAFTPFENIEFTRILFENIKLSKNAQVGALPSYNASDLSIIKIRMPRSSGEQQKIADFLTSVDDKIAQEQDRLKNAKQFKKALLQRMFVQ